MTNAKNNLNLMVTKNDGENAKKRDWSTLLPELLQMIMSLLIVKDSIHASVVCKKWYKASVSIRMNDRHLWLFQYPFSSSIKRVCEFYDPLQDMTYTKEFPELVGMSIYYSKDGWLLMRKDRKSSELFFFNPFTSKLIGLPNCQNYNECAIFTCAPTSTECLVFGLTNINNRKNIVAINTFKLGENKWKTIHFQSPELFFAYNNKIVFSHGLFYCLGGLCWLAIFDPSKETWNTHHLKCSTTATTKWFRTYLLDIKGDIFLLRTLGENPQVFRLNRDDESWNWEEKDRFDEGLTIFGASRASESRLDLAGYMANKLLLSDLHHPMIYTYCFDKERYSRDKSYTTSLEMKTIYQSVWIEPPKQKITLQD